MEHVTEEPRKRITARVSDKVRATLEQAAELLGATVNQFVVQTAYQEAQRGIERAIAHPWLFLTQYLSAKIGIAFSTGGKKTAARCARYPAWPIGRSQDVSTSRHW